MKRHPITQMFLMMCLITLAGGAWADSHKKHADDAKKVAKAAPPMVYIPPNRGAGRAQIDVDSGPDL